MVVYAWQAHSAVIAVRWTLDVTSDERGVPAAPDAVVIYSDYSDEAGGIGYRDLSLRVTDLRYRPESGWPTWRGEAGDLYVPPPNQAELLQSWVATEAARSKLIRQRELEAPPTKFDPRAAGEDARWFYARVAVFYKDAEPWGKPTMRLSQAAEVPYSTAAAWVHQARSRGYLPPTTPGRARGLGISASEQRRTADGSTRAATRSSRRRASRSEGES